MTYSWGSALARSTPGSILPPAPQAENVDIHLAQKFGNDKPHGQATAMRRPRNRKPL
jgi:hypothetical protein